MTTTYVWNSSLALSAVTASLGGSAVGAGATTSASVVIPGASALAKYNSSYNVTVGAAVFCSPAFAGGPGNGFVWTACINDSSVTDQVTVTLTNVTSGSLTPTAGVYIVYVMPF